jgi:hypothetical protein
MKTQMEYPLIVLVALVILVALWNIWSGMQVDLSVASLNATIAGTEAPAPVMMAGEWVVNNGGFKIPSRKNGKAAQTQTGCASHSQNRWVRPK